MSVQNIRFSYTIDDKALIENQKHLEDTQKELGATQKELGDTEKKFKDTDKQLSSTNKLLSGLGGQLKATANNINIMGVGLGDLAEKSYKSVTGIKGVVTALKGFKIALAATGIGLLIVGLGSLVAFFTKTQRGVDMANRAFAAIGATVSVFTDRLSMLGEKLINLDFKGILGVFKGITTEIKAEASAAMTLEGAMQRVRDQEIALNIERSESRKRVKELNLIAEDVTKTLEQRANAAREAISIESGLLQSQIELQQKKVALITEQNRLGESLTADVEREAAEREKLNQLSESSLELQTTLNNKLNILEAQRISQGNTLLQNKKDQETALDGIIAKVKVLSKEQETLLEINEQVFTGTKSIGDVMSLSLDKVKKSLTTFQEEYKAKKDQELKEDQERDQQRAANTAAANELISQSITTLSDLRVGKLQSELQALETNYQRDIELAGDNEQRKAAIQKKFDAESRKIKTQQFKADRTAALSQTAFNTAKAIAASLPNVPLSIIVGAIGAAQTASILSQPIPKFRQGGLIGGKRHEYGGTHIEAERGEYVLRREAVDKYGLKNIEKINKLQASPQIMYISDNKDIIEALGNKPNLSLTWDENGFTSQLRTKNHLIEKKQKRVSF